MSARGYGEPLGGEYGSREGSRDRWREREERSSWRGEQRGRDEDRGFFERAGEEIRSWFGDDDDDRRRGRDFERGSGHLREQQRSGRGGWGGQDWERERSHGGAGRGRGDMPSEQRSGFGGMAQSGVSGDWNRGRERDSGSWTDRDRFGQGRSMERGRRGEDFDRGGWGGQSSERRGHAQSWGEANRGESGESIGYSEFGGTLGGFGNQRFASSQDELYRRWRDRQMEQLDREYEDYCRDCEQKFHQDFDSWRRSRQTQRQGQSQENSDELILGGGSTGSAESGGTTATGSSASDTTGSTEMAGAGGTSDSDLGSGSGSGRSGSRSRS